MGAYLELIRQQKQNQQQESELRLNMMQAAETDPDSLARAKKSADMLGLPLQAVQERLPEVEKEAFVEGFGYRDLIKNAPKTAEWLAADPLHAGVAKDDIENLSYMERLFSDIGQKFEQGRMTTELSDIGFAAITGKVSDKQRARQSEIEKAMQGQKDYGITGFFEGIPSAVANQLPILGQTLLGKVKGAAVGGAGGAAVGAGTALVAGQLGPQVAAPEEVVTVPVAAVAMGARGAVLGWKYGAAVEAGKLEASLAYLDFEKIKDETGQPLDRNIALTAALLVGGVNGALEGLTGVERMVDSLPGIKNFTREGMKQALKSPTVRAALLNYSKRIVTTAGTEGATEFLQNMVKVTGGEIGRAVQEGSTDGLLDRIFSDQNLTQSLAEARAGAQAGGGMATVLATPEAVSDTRAARNAQQTQQVFQAIGDVSTNSKLRERLPEKFKELAERYAGAQNAFIDAAQFNQYFQAQGIDPAAVASELGVPNYREAVAAGTDIVIPMGEFASKLAPTDHLQGLMPDLKLSQGELSAREFEQSQAQAAEQEQEIAGQAETETPDASRQQIHDDIMGQLVGRFERSTAEAYATQYTAGISTLAERMGMDPLELHQRYGLTITSPLPDVLTKRPDLDTVIDPMIDAIRAGTLPSDAEVNGPSLTEFLRERGGVMDEGGELASRDAKQQIRGLVRDNGMSLDAAREAAAEAGYISEDSTVSDFIDLLDNELRGDMVYSDRNRNDSLAEQQNALRELSNWMDQQGIDLNSTDNAAIKRMMYPESEGREFEQISPEQAMSLNYETKLPDDPIFAEAVANTPGAQVTSDGLLVDLVRFQKVEQEGAQAIRTGVFYLPVGSPNAKHYRTTPTTKAPNAYGGTEKMEGQTLIRKPLFVKGATGGKAPEAAYDTIKGKGAMKALDKAVMDVVTSRGWMNEMADDLFEERVQQFLTDNGGDPNLAWKIIQNSKAGNTLRYSLQEHVIAHAVRNAGYDSVVGYSKGKAGPFISEVFDVREQTYPARGMDSQVHDTFYQSAAAGDVTQTPEFKAWFGSSKVVDADGKPLVVYHGTSADFDTFSLDKIGLNGLAIGPGFYFTNSKNVAEGYGRAMEVYLRAENPTLSLEKRTINKKQVQSIIEALEKEDEYFLSNYGDIEYEGRPKVLRAALDDIYAGSKNDAEIIGSIINVGGVERDTVMRAVIDATGKDGFVADANMASFAAGDTDVIYTVLLPTQIKSAIGNRGSFDASNPNILFQGVDEYGMSHRPPGPDNGAPLDDLTGGGTIYPDDIYSAKADQYYGHFGGGDAMDKATIRLINSYRGNPDAPVKVYRAVPADIDGDDINPGDWITINKKYAEYHGESQFENGYKILEKMVKAKEIFTNGDSIHEYGYWPGRSYEQRQQDGARGYIRIGDNQRMSIALLESANLSTFLHETGHMYLEVLGDLAASENAPEQIRDDYKTILDWFGVDSREQIQTEHHEQFARGNEAYLMEGKAPSAALRAVFQRFKAWLTMIYRSISRLDVQLTPEVRAVFDRIYASDEEIESARAEAGMMALFSSPEQMGLTDAEFKAYRNSVTDASVIAQDKLRTELMREYQREQQKWFKERRAEVRASVEAEVDQNPVYVAFDALAAGQFNDQPIKLAKKDLVRRYGDAYLKRLPRGFQRLYSAEGGIDTDMAAEMLGFDSGDALVHALVNMRPRKQLIEAETDARMREQYGDMMLDGTIAERAEFALHNDKRADILMAELKALRRKQREVEPFVKAGRQKARDARAAARSSADSIPPHEVFRNTARGLVSQQALRDLQPQKYLLAERRASRRAFEAMAKGEVTVAANEKQKELLNHYLYLEATKAKEQAEKISEYMGKFERKTIRQKLGKAGADYLEQIDNILGRYEFRRMPLRTMDRRASLIAWAQQQEAAGMTVNIPDYLMDEARQVNYRSVTIDELQAVYDTVRNIEHLAGLKNKLLRKRDAVDFDEAKQELVGSLLANLNNTGELDKLNKKADTLADKTVGLWKRFDASMLKVEQLVEWMDGGNINGPWARYVFDLADDAQTREYDLHRDVTQKIVALHESMSPEWRASLQDKITAIGLDGVKTRYDLLSIAFNVGNASNYDKLLRGRSWDDNDVQNALGQLTAEDKQFVQGMWDIVETLWPEMAELEKRVTGVTPVKIDAAPQVAAFEGMRGGYFPVVYDPRNSAFGAKQAESTQSVQDFMATGYGRATTDKGATRERTDAAAPLLLDYEQVLTSHLAKVIKDVSHREAIISLNKILNDNEIKAAMISTLGEDRYQLFNVWEQRLISDRSDTMHQGLGFWGDIMRGLRTNTAIVTMGWKISTMLSQFAGFGPSADLVKPRFLAKGLIAAVQHPVDSLAFVVERSGEMRNRTNTLERDMKDALLKIRGEQSRTASIQRTAFYLTAMADRMVTIPTWLGAYQQALAENATEEDAIRAGDRAVRLSQGSGGAKDLASVQANNELMKLVTMYYTPFSVLYSRLRDVGHNTNGIHDLPHAAARVIALALLPAVMGELLAGRGPDDDEDETMWAVRKMLMYPLATVPMLRDLASWQIEPILAEASGGKLRYAPGYQFSPVIKATEKIVRLPEKAYDAMTGERPWDEVAWDLFESAGYVFGLPTAQPRITGEYLVDLFTGGADPETAGEAMNDLLFRRPPQ